MDHDVDRRDLDHPDVGEASRLQQLDEAGGRQQLAAEVRLEVLDARHDLARQRPAAFQALGEREPAESVSLVIARNDDERTLAVTLSATPSEVPTEIPERLGTKKAVPDEKDRWSEIRLVDEPNECLLREPPSGIEPVGLIVWLLPPGKIDQPEFDKTWGEWCDQRGFLLALPRPRNDGGWEFGEIETIRKLLESIVAKYDVDPQRIVVGGFQTGGSLAAAYAFLNRERIRGVALVDAVLPPRVQPRGNDPESRLEFLQVRFNGSRANGDMKSVRDRLREMRFPVVDQEQSAEAAPPDVKTVELILRWSDSLDRL